MPINKLFLLAALGFLSVSSLYAQKHGHLNVGNLLEMMPETKAADDELKAYQEELVSKGEKMANDFRAQAEQFLADRKAGNLSPVQEQNLGDELKKKQEDILQYEQEIQQKVAQKRGELLEPLERKVLNAVEKVARANGYAMVFNTSTFNTILYLQEADDLMPLVKKELGIP